MSTSDTIRHTSGRSTFRALPISPEGIFWEDDFITSEHEQRLISIFQNDLEWPDRPGRISLHYGYTFDYKTFGIDPDIPYKEFPDWLQPLIPMTESRPPDQVCLQFYPPGAGIPPHVDAHGPYDQLYALSIGGPAVMQFRKGEERVDIDLAPRSMMQMTGESRLHWTHGIKKRKNDTLPDGTQRPRTKRWSLTYRWLRPGGSVNAGISCTAIPLSAGWAWKRRRDPYRRSLLRRRLRITPPNEQSLIVQSHFRGHQALLLGRPSGVLAVLYLHKSMGSSGITHIWNDCLCAMLAIRSDSGEFFSLSDSGWFTTGTRKSPMDLLTSSKRSRSNGAKAVLKTDL